MASINSTVKSMKFSICYSPKELVKMSKKIENSYWEFLLVTCLKLNVYYVITIK